MSFKINDSFLNASFGHFKRRLVKPGISNIPELQLQEYCNILKKLKEGFVVHRMRNFHPCDSSINLFSNPMQINMQDDTETWGYLQPQQHMYVF